MSRRPTQTRERIVEAALYLFWLQGFAGLGWRKSLPEPRLMPEAFTTFSRPKKSCFSPCSIYTCGYLMPVVVQPVLTQCADPIERVFGILAFYRRNLICDRDAHMVVQSDVWRWRFLKNSIASTSAWPTSWIVRAARSQELPGRSGRSSPAEHQSRNSFEVRPHSDGRWRNAVARPSRR